MSKLLVLAILMLALPGIGQTTGIPAPGVTAASCASGYFVNGDVGEWNGNAYLRHRRGQLLLSQRAELQCVGHHHSGKPGVCDDVHSNAVGDDIARNGNRCCEVALRFGWAVKRC